MRASAVALLVLLAGCAVSQPPVEEAPAASRPVREGPTRAGQDDLEVLASFFTGNWDSRPNDPPMRLRVAEFWKGSPVRWFYLEWVRGGGARPARQLVLRVAEDGGSGIMTATFHRLPGNAADYAGEWSKAQPFAQLKPPDLRSVEACRLRTVRTLAAHFTLVTEGNRCPGDLPGMPFMRFEFSLASSEMNLLEQPRDAAGNVPPNSRLAPFGYLRMSTEPR